MIFKAVLSTLLLFWMSVHGDLEIDDELYKEWQSFERTSYDDAIYDLLVEFRENMTGPSSLLGLELPTLDPLLVEALALDLNIPDTLSLTGFINDLNVTNLSTFEITNAKFEMIGFKLAVGITLEDLIINGLYNIDGMVGGDAMHLFGDGFFNVSLQGISLDVGIAMKSNTTTHVMYIDRLDLDFSLNKTDLWFDNLLGGGELGNITNQALSNILPEVLEEEKATLAETVSSSLIALANANLHLTMSELLSLLSR